jgi:hypothetical protein
MFDVDIAFRALLVESTVRIPLEVLLCRFNVIDRAGLTRVQNLTASHR